MKKNVFRNMLAFAMAAAISVGFTSCSSDDDVITITDNNDDEWLVRYIDGIKCYYDEDNKLISIIEDDFDEVYYVTADGTLNFAWAEGSESGKAQVTLDDDNNITKIEYSGIRYDNKKWEGTYDFTYNNERLQSYAATCKEENLNKNNQNSWTSSATNIGANFTWANENLSNWTVTQNRETNYNNANSEKYRNKDTYEYSYSTQENPCKQFPYLIGKYLDIASNDEISGIFSVLGLFGYGPKQLPFSCKNTYEYSYGTNSPSTSTYNYTYAFTLNENGTLNSETLYSEGNTYGTTYSYVYTPTRAGSTGKHSLKELIRNMRPRDSFERNEQEQ